MSWLDKILPPKINKEAATKSNGIPEGLWQKCPSCAATLYATDLKKNMEVCPKCGYHNPVSARERIQMMLDEGKQYEIGANVKPMDMLKFRDSKKYTDRLSAARKLTHEEEAMVVMRGDRKSVV